MKRNKVHESIEEFKSSKLLVYTVMLEYYNVLKPPKYIDENCDYVCFTNNRDAQSEIWKIVIVEDNYNLGDSRFASKIKILPHRYILEFEIL